MNIKKLAIKLKQLIEKEGEIMKKKSPKEILKSFSNVYIIFAVIFLIGAIAFNVIPGFADSLKNTTGDENAMLNLNVSIVVDIMIYLWYSWLAKRVVDGKSNGTLFMVLLILNVISGIVRLISTPGTRGMGTLDFVLNAVTLYYLLKVRKENIE